MTMLHLLEIILCMYFLKTFQKYLCKCYIKVMSVLYSENIFDISAGEIPYKSQVFKIFSGEKCRVCISSKFLHDTFFLTSITLMSVQVYYFIMKVSDYHYFLFLYCSNLLLPQNEALRLQTESYRTWRACLSYGLADDLFTYASW